MRISDGFFSLCLCWNHHQLCNRIVSYDGTTWRQKIPCFYTGGVIIIGSGCFNKYSASYVFSEWWSTILLRARSRELSGHHIFAQWIRRDRLIAREIAWSVVIFLCGLLKGFIYETPLEFEKELVSRISHRAEWVREVPGVFQKVRQSCLRVIFWRNFCNYF